MAATQSAWGQPLVPSAEQSRIIDAASSYGKFRSEFNQLLKGLEATVNEPLSDELRQMASERLSSILARLQKQRSDDAEADSVVELWSLERNLGHLRAAQQKKPEAIAPELHEAYLRVLANEEKRVIERIKTLRGQ